jgi:hypothetical protein
MLEYPGNTQLRKRDPTSQGSYELHCDQKVKVSERHYGEGENQNNVQIRILGCVSTRGCPIERWGK